MNEEKQKALDWFWEFLQSQTIEELYALFDNETYKSENCQKLIQCHIELRLK